MLLPYHSGTSDALETLEHTTRDHVEDWSGVDASPSIPSEPAYIGRRSRARVRCTWKDCDYLEANTEEMKWVTLGLLYFFFGLVCLATMLLKICPRKHAASHRSCPKEDCNWAEARDGKEKSRHVWYKHRSWAERTGYPPMSAECDECDAVFARKDGLSRHKKEVHRAKKRVRTSRG